MFQIKAEHAIVKMVDILLPDGNGIRDRGLQISLDVSLSNEGVAKEARESAHFIFVKPYNYVRVFYARNTSIKDPSIEQYRDVSYHDSVWRYDAFYPLADQYFEMAQSVNPAVAPKDLFEHSYIENVRMVRVEMEKDPDNDHRRKLTEITPWKD